MYVDHLTDDLKEDWNEEKWSSPSLTVVSPNSLLLHSSLLPFGQSLEPF